MPKVTFLYRRDTPWIKYNLLELQEIGKAVRKLVAEAMGTEKIPLTEDDVDWIPLRLPDGSIIAPISLEIEAIGYSERKEKLADWKLVAKLKLDLLEALDPDNINCKIMDIRPETPLLWIKFQDPDGLHV